MNAKELQSKTAHELQRLSGELHDQLRAERFKVATRQHSKVHTLRTIRKDIARVTHALSQKSDSSSSHV